MGRVHRSATEASYNESMNLPDSEFRLVGVAAAISGLVVVMLAGEPSVASLGWGCLGLFLFGLSRLMPRPRPKPVLEMAPVATPTAVDVAAGDKRGDPATAKAGDVHAVLQRTVRVQRPGNPMIVSSVLPRSRASRSPSTG